MKGSTKVVVGIFVVVLGILVGSRMNGVETLNVNRQTTVKKDPFTELRSDGKHTEQENLIKDKVDKYMYENFGNVFKTTWYGSISASGAVINEYGKVLCSSFKRRR